MPDDSIFAERSDPSKSAGLGVGEFPWGTFARGYRLAAEKLLESFRNPVDLEAVCYPLLFNARHFVELRMKDIITCATFSLDGLSETFEKHELSPLFLRVQTLAERAEPISDLDWWRPIDEYVKTFDRFDHGSFSFRYPFNKEGKAQLRELLDFDSCSQSVFRSQQIDLMRWRTSSIKEFACGAKPRFS